MGFVGFVPFDLHNMPIILKVQNIDKKTTTLKSWVCMSINLPSPSQYTVEPTFVEIPAVNQLG